MNVQIKAIAAIDESATSGLMAQLYLEKENKKIEFLKSLTIPIEGGYWVSGERLQVDEGKYIIQVLLPDGQTVTNDFEIKSFENEKEVLIYLPHEGPHEWTALHAMAGNFRWEAQITKGFENPLSLNPKGKYKSLSRDFREGYELSLLKADKNLRSEIFGDDYTIDKLSRLIQNNLDVKNAIEKFGATLKIEEPTREDTDFAMFKIAYSGVLSKHETPSISHRFYPRRNFPRHYLLQKSVLGGTLISLPTPWIKPFDNGEAEMEFLVKKNSIGDPLELAMTINEPMINTVLGYINVGAFHQATQLISTDYALRMLFQKIENPFAAVVGTYLLILENNRERSLLANNYWKEWINNLDKWFPWLPDGAVLNAAKHFWLRDYSRSDKNDFDVSFNESFKALNRAYERGLPVFTFGLKLMMDGFRYFANEKINEAKARLNKLETIADKTDPSQPFLTINFSQR
ncbi:MAG TPA: hypothetical protein VIL74_07250 [Pyrinomonadaceae bacterium]|jgi:hypothetical protein